MGRTITESSMAGTPRCGRCAEILPDETLSYCPSCGVPFSRIPPTTSYFRFEEQRQRLFERRRRLALGGLSLAIVGLLGALVVLIDSLSLPSAPHQTGFVRPLHFYFRDVPGYPTLPLAVKRDAVNVALQAFEDHFGARITEYSMTFDQAPQSIEKFFGDPNQLTDFATWESSLFPEAERQWNPDNLKALPVLITNIPVTIGESTHPIIETRHLSHSKLVSGLGHPALVMVSAFRMLTEDPTYKKSRFVTRSDAERARLLGEYLLAHELGHALVGLGDYVVSPPPTSTPTLMRRPALAEALTYPQAYAECLMHTDEAGGFKAWELLSQRPLGRASRCREYDGLLEAYQNRAEAWNQRSEGEDIRAEVTHAHALEQARSSLSPWALRRWESEHRSFLSLFDRWMNSFGVVQSKHDQL